MEAPLSSVEGDEGEEFEPLHPETADAAAHRVKIASDERAGTPESYQKHCLVVRGRRCFP